MMKVREKKRGLDIRQLEPGRQHEKIKLPITRSLRPRALLMLVCLTTLRYDAMLIYLSCSGGWLHHPEWHVVYVLSPPTFVIDDKF